MAGAATGDGERTIVVLLGPPGAGKGTQGEQLATALGIPKISTGDVLRAAVRDGTPLGREAQGYMDRGDLVPDPVILGIMTDALGQPSSARGAILDGVVRTVPQAEGLQAALSQMARVNTVVLVFAIDDDVLVRRISERTIIVPKLFLAELVRIRAEGLAYDQEESRPGLVCVASAVHGPGGVVRGAWRSGLG